MASGSTVIVKRDGVKKFFAKLSIYNRYEVVVGVPQDAENEEGDSLAAIGATHEFGSPKRRIPQRSFLRDTFDINERKYANLLELGVAAAIAKNVRPEQTLFKVGQVARGDVVKRFNDGIGPALSQTTIDRKGSDLQLVDTGALRSSITARVRKDGEDVA